MPYTRNSQQTREKLIETTCQMIEEKGGSSHVNMRIVAEKTGCAHSNVYYYFESYNDLLYASMLRAMEKLVAFTQSRVGTQARTAEHFPAFICAQIDFALQNPGLYRFIWLEQLVGPVPEKIKEFGMMLKNRFAGLVFNTAGKLTRERALEVSIVLHSYLHGEICKLICGREPDLNTTEAREQIMANINKLMAVLSEKYAEVSEQEN